VVSINQAVSQAVVINSIGKRWKEPLSDLGFEAALAKMLDFAETLALFPLSTL
jgi:hypothetical protein